MSATFIDTNKCERSSLDGQQGDVADIINRNLCGAEDVVGKLRWLSGGQRFDAAALAHSHQLIYLMEGDGTIELEGKRYPVTQGAGAYLGPEETASVGCDGDGTLKLLHLIVPIKR